MMYTSEDANLVGHPGPLNLEVPTTHSPNNLGELGLGVDHFNDVG
jgi:hypothetical protein